MGIKKPQKHSNQIKKYGAILCPVCGYIQNRQLTGSVFKYKGPFTSVNCIWCGKRVIVIQNLLFETDSARIARGWIVDYKNKIKGE
jgi:DNA-directed RNA polymerase subunit RPC12/RpoP